MNRPTVYIADDHEMIIDGLKLLIDDAIFRVSGSAKTGEDACRGIASTKPDIALLDLHMPPGMSGLEVLYSLKQHKLPTRFVILSMYDQPRNIRDAMNHGAVGYLLKNVGRTELMRCLTAVHRGELYFPKLPAPLHDSKPLFTPREVEIIKLGIEEVLTTAEMAKRLYLSARTVETHRKSINNKTSSKTPSGWAKFLKEHNIQL